MKLTTHHHKVTGARKLVCVCVCVCVYVQAHARVCAVYAKRIIEPIFIHDS
jgi:hypothetical protein